MMMLESWKPLLADQAWIEALSKSFITPTSGSSRNGALAPKVFLAWEGFTYEGMYNLSYGFHHVHYNFE